MVEGVKKFFVFMFVFVRIFLYGVVVYVGREVVSIGVNNIFWCGAVDGTVLCDTVRYGRDCLGFFLLFVL